MGQRLPRPAQRRASLGYMSTLHFRTEMCLLPMAKQRYRVVWGFFHRWVALRQSTQDNPMHFWWLEGLLFWRKFWAFLHWRLLKNRVYANLNGGWYRLYEVVRLFGLSIEVFHIGVNPDGYAKWRYWLGKPTALHYNNGSLLGVLW